MLCCFVSYNYFLAVQGKCNLFVLCFSINCTKLMILYFVFLLYATLDHNLSVVCYFLLYNFHISRHLLLALSILSNCSGLFHSLFWIKLKRSVVVKGLKIWTSRCFHKDSYKHICTKLALYIQLV